MAFGPPPPPGSFSGDRRPGVPRDEFKHRADARRKYKERDGEENRAVLRWLVSTGKQHLPGVFILIFFSVISSLASVLFALVSQHAIDCAVNKDINGLIAFASGLAAVGVGQILIRAISTYWNEKVSARVENAYRSRLFDAILTRRFSQIGSYHSGDLMNRMTDDVNIVVNGVTSFLPSIAEIIANLVGAGSVLLLTDWRFCLIYIAATVALIVVNRVYRHAIKEFSTIVREKDGKNRSFYQDSIMSLMVLRVFVTEESARNRSDELLNDFYSSRLKRSWVRIKSNSIMGLSMNFGHIFALIWCSFQLIWGTMTYGQLVAIMQLTGQVRMPFISASNLSSQYYSMIASGERLMEIEALDKELSAEEEELMKNGFDARAYYDRFQCLRAKDLVFAYDEDAALDHVAFEFDKGDIVAIMGQSGCGKSTLFKLILGVLQMQEGSLDIIGGGEGPANSVPCEEGWTVPVGPTMRRLFAYVPQGNLLITGRLRDNIAFARQDATDEEVWNALELACAAEFVRTLPRGLDTFIGERGNGLSEGQMQRIAVARAYLSEAPILLLDEATSSLDEDTEARLLTNLRELEDRTVLIVTHRKAALSICNKRLDLMGQATWWQK